MNDSERITELEKQLAELKDHVNTLTDTINVMVRERNQAVQLANEASRPNAHLRMFGPELAKFLEGEHPDSPK